MPEYVNDYSENLVIKTTFQPPLQKLAEDALASQMLQFGEQSNASQAAILSMRPDGAVLAMVGGVDYAESQFNRATQAKRQPGSLFKLFVYMAALENGKLPDDMIADEPFSIRTGGKNWSPKNYDGKYNGNVSLSYALAKSLNVATSRLSEQIGRQKVIDLAHRMGVKSVLEDVPSVALGSSEVTLLEMVQAFATMPNAGNAVAPYVIDEVKSGDGTVLYQREGEYNLQVLAESSVKFMNGMLMGVVQEGTAKAAQIGRDVAGKTGTTQSYRDAWFVGYTPELVTGVWVGNDNNKQMKSVTGGGIPARIWRDYSSIALADLPHKTLETNPYPEIQGTPWNGGDSGDSQGFWDSLVGF